MTTCTEVRVADFKINNRIRKEYGDINELAESMNSGLLQPIGITPEKVLVFGERRVLAARDILGWKTIPARIVDVQSVLHGQFAENLMRKEYTVSERVAIVEALRSFKHGGDRRSGQVRNCDDETLTIDEAAKRAGLGGKDGYFRAKVVLDKGVPELVEAMDGGRLSLSAAATLAEAEADEQKECFCRQLNEQKWTANGVKRALQKVRSARGRADATRKAVASQDMENAIRTFHCPFQKLEQKAKLEPESASLICTDIPYGKQFLPELRDLAKFADRHLRQGGLFVTYSGQFWLPEVMQALGERLSYRWMLASIWDGKATVVHPRQAISKWKPILVYSKGAAPRFTGPE